MKAARGRKPGYKAFGYYGDMPKLNLQNRAAADYIIDVAVYWVRECGIDGWRLDVGDEISHTFWKRFRREIKAVKEDALIVGEIWHFAGDFLAGDEWDSVMNYPFYYAVLELAASQTMGASAFMDRLGFMRGNLNRALDGYLCSHASPQALRHSLTVTSTEALPSSVNTMRTNFLPSSFIHVFS